MEDKGALVIMGLFVVVVEDDDRRESEGCSGRMQTTTP